MKGMITVKKVRVSEEGTCNECKPSQRTPEERKQLYETGEVYAINIGSLKDPTRGYYGLLLCEEHLPTFFYGLPFPSVYNEKSGTHEVLIEEKREGDKKWTHRYERQLSGPFQLRIFPGGKE